MVIDKSKECAENPDFMLTIPDVEAWKKEYVHSGKCVRRIRSDWYKKIDLEFLTKTASPIIRYRDIQLIRWLVKEHNIGAIGHEPADPGFITTKEGSYPYPGEQCILQLDRIQIEVMRNLDQVPPTGSIIDCTFPKNQRRHRCAGTLLAICPVRLSETAYTRNLRGYLLPGFLFLFY